MISSDVSHASSADLSIVIRRCQLLVGDQSLTGNSSTVPMLKKYAQKPFNNL